eukprot:956325_1
MAACKPKDGKECLSLQRYQNDANHITEGRLDKNNDAEFNLYKDVMDSIHCSLYHPYDIAQIHADKYTLPKLDIDDPGALMHMKHLWHYLCDIGRDDLIISTWSVLNTEEFDSDSLLHYVMHTKERELSPVATELEKDYSVFVEFFDSLLV